MLESNGLKVEKAPTREMYRKTSKTDPTDFTTCTVQNPNANHTICKTAVVFCVAEKGGH